MTGRAPGALLVALVLAVCGAMVACGEINTDPKVAISIAFDSVAAPSIVVGDTMRDTLGAIRPLRATGFNAQGNVVAQLPFRYFTPDRGIRVDSLTGMAVAGDSVRVVTPVRVVAQLGRLQSPPDSIYVIPRPDAVVPVNALDSLVYAPGDTAPVSNVLSVKITHGAAGDSAVRSYIVSFALVSPVDTTIVRLVNESGQSSHVDTTDANGVAGRAVRLRPLLLGSLRDSVVVRATARYRGIPLPGSPVRLVLRVRPKT